LGKFLLIVRVEIPPTKLFRRPFQTWQCDLKHTQVMKFKTLLSSIFGNAITQINTRSLPILAFAVGLSGIAGMSHAAIVHTDFSAAPITINNTPSTFDLTINGSIFQFSQSYTTTLDNNGMMQIKAMTPGAAVATQGDLESIDQNPSTIPLSMLVAENTSNLEMVGSENQYSNEIQLLNHNEYYHYGSFIVSWSQQGQKSGYIGVSLQDPADGLTRYGWIQYTGWEFRTRVDENAAWIYKSAGIISGFAYETTPDLAIAAGAIPEPSAAWISGLLGSVILLRRRVSRQTAP
jgi:hypothetical protein